MARKRYTPEQIIQMLREAEILIGHGQSVESAIRQLAITPKTYYSWRKEYRGLKLHQAKRFKRVCSFNNPSKLRSV